MRTTHRFSQHQIAVCGSRYSRAGINLHKLLALVFSREVINVVLIVICSNLVQTRQHLAAVDGTRIANEAVSAEVLSI